MTDFSNQSRFKKILIVDDNEIDRYICERTAKMFHLAETTVNTSSAIDALEYLISLLKTPEQLPEIIFLDINMPEMNGFEFLYAFDELPEVIRKKCTIIMLTSSKHKEDEDRAMRNKYVRGYLHKPIDKDKLRQLLDYSLSVQIKNNNQPMGFIGPMPAPDFKMSYMEVR